MMIRNCCLALAFFVCHSLSLYAQAPQLSIAPLADGIFTYTTHQDYQGTPYPATGLYVVTPGGVALLDTPWDTAACLPLLDSIRHRHGLEVRWSISTHFHADRTGSINVLRRQGVATWASAQTRDLCIAKGEPVPEFVFLRDTVFRFGGVEVETFYPGAGHAPDNIVVWLPAQQVLHGGCLVKSVQSNSVGNLSDADLAQWPASLQAVKARYPNARIVVPGHPGGTSPKALDHTLRLIQKHTRKQNQKK